MEFHHDKVLPYEENFPMPGECFAIIPRCQYFTEDGEKKFLPNELPPQGGWYMYRAQWSGKSRIYDENTILALNITKEFALRLGKEYGISAIIYKQGNQVSEICTKAINGYEEGETISTWELSESDTFTNADVVTCFKNRTLHPLGSEAILEKITTILKVAPVISGRPLSREVIYQREQQPSDSTDTKQQKDRGDAIDR